MSFYATLTEAPDVSPIQPWPSGRRQVAKEFVVNRVSWRPNGLETFPKTATYCHLLPFWSRKTATSVSAVAFLTCPLRHACWPDIGIYLCVMVGGPQV